MRRITFIVLVVVVSACSLVSGQDPDPDYVFSITDAAGPPLGQATVLFLVTNTGDPIQGYQWGACSDELLEIGEGDVVDGDDVVDLDYTFNAATIVDGGFTVGALLNPLSESEIGLVTDFELIEATYTLPDLEEGEFLIEFCDTLGTPLVPTSVVVEGDDLVPTQNSGRIEIKRLPFLFELSTEVVEYRPEDGLTREDDVVTAVLTASIFEDEELSEEFPSGTQGFSMGITYAPGLLTVTDLVEIGPLLDLNGGDGPEFVGINLEATDGDVTEGVTVGVVYVGLSDETIIYDEATDVIEITVEADTDQLLDNLVGATCLFEFTDLLGDPPVRTTVVIGGFSQEIRVLEGSVTLAPIIQTPFLRGDCNDTGFVDFSDGIFLFQQLFEVNTIECDTACNANGEEEVGGVLLGLADGIFLFEYSFVGGPRPPAPFPDCGQATEEIELDRCDSFQGCE